MDGGERMTKHYMQQIETVLTQANDMAHTGHRKYGDSCLNRGGSGLFHMLARKWDRIEKAAKENNYDIFQAIAANPGPDGMMDDIMDLVVYLSIAAAQWEVLPSEENARIMKILEDDRIIETAVNRARTAANEVRSGVDHPSPFGYQEEQDVKKD